MPTLPTRLYDAFAAAPKATGRMVIGPTTMPVAIPQK